MVSVRTLMLVLLAISFCNIAVADKPNAAIMVSNLGGGKLQIVIANNGQDQIRIAKLNCLLGFDQFVIETLDSDGTLLSFHALPRNFTRHILAANVVQASSFCSETIDLFDGNWTVKGRIAKRENLATWRKVRVRYVPETCKLRDSRDFSEIYAVEMNSEWLDANVAPVITCTLKEDEEEKVEKASPGSD